MQTMAIINTKHLSL